MQNPNAYTEGTEDFLFISYSHADTETVYEILNELELNHFRFWYDSFIRTSSGWADELALKIETCQSFVVFLSKNSVCSDNVKDEIAWAKEKKKNIYAIKLDDVELTGGLALQLGRIQFNNYYDKPKAAFISAFLRDLGTNCIRALENLPSAKHSSGFEARYKLRELLHSGVTGKIYSALDKHTGAIVFVKYTVFDNSYTGQYAKKSAIAEHEIMVQMNSPFTPALTDYYEEDNAIILVEEMLHGRHIHPEDSYTEATAVSLALKLCHILLYLHEGSPKVLHLDIKPSNLLMTNQGDLYLLDFGTSKILGRDPVKANTGTRGYASPEQYGGYVDERADIYCLGKTLLALLWGEKDTNKTSLLADSAETIVLSKDSFSEFLYIRSTDIRLARIVDKMTCPDKDHRYSSVRDIIHDLTTYKERPEDDFEKVDMTYIPDFSHVSSEYINMPAASVLTGTVLNESTTMLWDDVPE